MCGGEVLRSGMWKGIYGVRLYANLVNEYPGI